MKRYVIRRVVLVIAVLAEDLVVAVVGQELEHLAVPLVAVRQELVDFVKDAGSRLRAARLVRQSVVMFHLVVRSKRA